MGSCDSGDETGWERAMGKTPHRKATRAKDESKTEEDGYYRAGQDGNNRNSRTGQMRRARRSSGGLTRRLELLGRRKLPGGARGIARRSRVGVREGRGKQQVGMNGAGDWNGYGGWEDE